MFPSVDAARVARTPRDAIEGSPGGRSEAFKRRPDDARGMEDLILEENEELLSPVVVVATIALIGVFVLGAVYRLVGLGL